ncbi:MAG: TIGR04255 family protein [Candidatus Thiodiazotropha endolucinida]
MIAKRHLNNAPIKEAIIDIQITRNNDFDIKTFEHLYSKIKSEYPSTDSINKGLLGFQFRSDNSMSTTMDQQHAGYKYSSFDKINIVQFRNNGFTFSRLEPYDTWESMSTEAKRLWDIYKETCDSCSINRIATRYINVMRIPLPIEDFKVYLTSPPTIPETLPQGVSSFLTRVVIQNPEIQSHGIVTQALDRPEEGCAPITLDIDVVKHGDYDTDDNDFWADLEKMRAFKNDIFFESITEKTAELFE